MGRYQWIVRLHNNKRAQLGTPMSSIHIMTCSEIYHIITTLGVDTRCRVVEWSLSRWHDKAVLEEDLQGTQFFCLMMRQETLYIVCTWIDRLQLVDAS